VAEEQAALRRLATLVAGGAPSEEVFAAVTAEVGRLLPVDYAALSRYESDRTLTYVAAWSATGKPFPPVGTRVTIGEQRQLARIRDASSVPDRQLCRCLWTAHWRYPRTGGDGDPRVCARA
jgi:GAF domain-containing protein